MYRFDRIKRIRKTLFEEVISSETERVDWKVGYHIYRDCVCQGHWHEGTDECVVLMKATWLNQRAKFKGRPARLCWLGRGIHSGLPNSLAAVGSCTVRITPKE